MKTPMQEFIESITLKDSKDHIVLIPTISKAEIESLLEKEKEVMIDFAYKFGDEQLLEIAKWYDKQFNTEDK